MKPSRQLRLITLIFLTTLPLLFQTPGARAAQQDENPILFQDEESIALAAIEDVSLGTVPTGIADGSQPELSISGLSGEQSWSLVKFDLSPLQTQAAPVARAYLILSPINVWAPVSFRIIQTSTPWDEMNTAHGTVTASTADPSVTYIFPPTASPVAFDVTPLVQNWLSGAVNNGLAIATNNTQRSGVTFRSREAADGQPPILLLETADAGDSALSRFAPAANEPAELAYARSNGEIWLARTDGSEPVRISEGGGNSSPQWSRAGDRLYYLRNAQRPESAIIEYDFATASERVVFSSERDTINAFAVLPLQDKLVLSYEVPSPFGEPDPIYGRSWDMCLAELDIETGVRSEFYCGGSLFITRITPMPDESLLIVTEAYFEGAGLAGITLDGVRRSLDNIDRILVDMDFSQGSTAVGVYFSYADFSFGLRLLDLYDWRLGEIPLVSGGNQPNFGPYGQRIAYVEGTGGGAPIKIYRIADGVSVPVANGNEPAWRPSPLQFLDPLLAEKRALFDDLETSFYRIDLFPVGFPIPAYDESSSRALVDYLAEPDNRASLTREEIERFQRLVLQEQTLAGTLRSYEGIRDDNADALVDFYGISFSTFALFLGDPQSNVVKKTLTDVGNAWIVLGYDGEERAIREAAFELTAEYYTAPFNDPADGFLFLAEQLVNEGIRRDVAMQWTNALTTTVQPTLETGVDSVLMEESPSWEMTGTYELAEIQSAQVLARTSGTAEDAQRLNEALLEGLAVNEVAKGISDFFTTQTPNLFTLTASVTTRFIQVALDLAMHINGQEAMVCIRDFSARAGDLIFQPDRDFVFNCEDLYPPEEETEWPDWVNPWNWFRLRRDVGTSTERYLDAVSAATEAVRSGDAAAVTVAETTLRARETALLAIVGNSIGLLAPPDPQDRHTGPTRELLKQMLLLEFGTLGYRGQLNAVLDGDQDPESVRLLEEAQMNVLQLGLDLSATLASLPAPAGDTPPTGPHLFLTTPYAIGADPGAPIQFTVTVENDGDERAAASEIVVSVGDAAQGGAVVAALEGGAAARVPLEIAPFEDPPPHVAVTLIDGERQQRRLVTLLPVDSLPPEAVDAQEPSDAAPIESPPDDSAGAAPADAEPPAPRRWPRPAGIAFIILGTLGLAWPLARRLTERRPEGTS